MIKFKTLTFPEEHININMGSIHEFNDQEHFDDWLTNHPFINNPFIQEDKLLFTKEDGTQGFAIIS